MNAKTKRNFIVCLAAAFLLAASLFCFNASSAFASNDNLVTLETGAYARVETGKESGIKFRGFVDKAYYDGLIETYGETKVYAGMILVPTENVPSSGFTFNNLDDGLKNNYKEASGTSKLAVDDDNYTFYVTGINIPEANYATQYSAVSYVKIVSDSTVDGFTAYKGAYYKYAEYVAANNARDIHTVAVTGYINSTDDTVKTELKKYLDPVASVEKKNDGSIAMQTIDGYTSPYQIKKYGDNYYAILNTTELDADASNDVSLSAIKYNGIKQDGFSVSDNDVTVALLQSKDAVIDNSNDTFTLGAVTVPGSAAGHAFNVGEIDFSYVALNDYKVGQFLEFEFTGNNMPQMTFFANEINSNISGYNVDRSSASTVVTKNDNKGISLLSGFSTHNDINRPLLLKTFSVWGPDRVYSVAKHDASGVLGNGTFIVDVHKNNAYKFYSYSESDASLYYFTQTGLETLFDKKLNYLVGTYVNGDGYVCVMGVLTDESKTTDYGTFNVSTGLTVEEAENLGSNVIAYGVAKNHANTTNKEATSFAFKGIYDSLNGAVLFDGELNDYNTVTLKGKVGAGAGHLAQIGDIDNSYIAFGNYTVGKYLAFEFTGNNMPQMTFFANKINGNMSNYAINNASNMFNNASGQYYDANRLNSVTDNKGITLYNGAVGFNTDNTAINTFSIWGPNRIVIKADSGNSISQGTVAQHMSTNALFSYTYATSGEKNCFTQQWLNENSTTEFKYVVGTYENTDGKVYVKGTLTSKDGATQYGTFDVSTGLTVAEVEALGDKVIAYGTIKGAANATTFTFTAPYTPEA